VSRAEPIALLTHVRAVPVAERELFGSRSQEALGDVGLVLRTCHRVEAYLVAQDVPVDLARSLPVGGRILVGEAAVRHAIVVATGRDSVVLGEDQVLHQLRVALASSRPLGRLDPVLERLMSLALRAGRRARSWRQGPTLSIADVALRVIERRGGSLRGRRLLVIGAGQMGSLAARAGVKSGAAVAIANRNADRAAILARTIGAQPAPFDPGESVAEVAGIVVAIDGPWAVAPRTAQVLADGSAVVVDLSVPTAVPTALSAAIGERFVGADALANTELGGPWNDLGPRARVEALVESTTAEFLAWLEGRQSRDTAGMLAARADLERQAELTRLFQRLPGLDVDAREAIAEMSRHLAARLLQTTFERLGEDPDGANERAARQLFGL
jgi:glutamyl-tRNA reductase